MAGIKAIQNSTTVNAAGASSFSTPQTGCVVGSDIVLSFTGTAPAGYAWTKSAPAGASNDFSSSSIAAPTIRPDQNGIWTFVLQTLDSNGAVTGTYMLPLDIPNTVTSTFTGPLLLPYLSSAQVESPARGYVLFLDADNSGAITAKDSLGTLYTVDLTQNP